MFWLLVVEVQLLLMMMVRLLFWLKIVLVMLLVKLLCQKLLLFIIEMVCLLVGVLSVVVLVLFKLQFMVVLFRLKGGRMENRWQLMLVLMWCVFSLCFISFMVVKMGCFGQLVQKFGGCVCIDWFSVGSLVFLMVILVFLVGVLLLVMGIMCGVLVVGVGVGVG